MATAKHRKSIPYGRLGLYFLHCGRSVVYKITIFTDGIENFTLFKNNKAPSPVEDLHSDILTKQPQLSAIFWDNAVAEKHSL